VLVLVYPWHLSLSPSAPWQCHKLNYGRRADCCQCGRAKGPDALYPPHLYDDRDGQVGGGRVRWWWWWWWLLLVVMYALTYL
jgi:hypothetical protein